MYGKVKMELIGKKRQICDHQTVYHNGYLYVIGGDNHLNEVHRSKDGQVWDLVTDKAGWGERWLHQVVVHDGHLYLIGGMDQD